MISSTRYAKRIPRRTAKLDPFAEPDYKTINKPTGRGGGGCIRIYIDTSVIGGCLDEEFRRWSLQLMTEFHGGQKHMVISTLTIRELEQAPEPVRLLLDGFAGEEIEILELAPPVLELAETYLREGAVGTGCLADA